MDAIIPCWVEADPAREVALDAVGLAPQADRIADALLPELSVLTRRARYLSFLPWAVMKAKHTSNPETTIHRYEAELALYEAKLHDGQETRCRGVVGRTSALSHLRQNGWVRPKRPEALYKSTAFRAYRSLLVSTRLIEGTSRPALTSEGAKIAAAFGSEARGPRACLTEISKTECRLLRGVLGFDLRLSVARSAPARRATYLELADRFGGSELSPQRVLARYARRPAASAQVPLLLHRAYVWEMLTLGLNLAFTCVLADMTLDGFASRLAKAQQGRPEPPPLDSDLSVDDSDAARHVVALVRHGLSLRPRELGLDETVVRLAECLREHSPKSFLEGLVARHQTVKGAETWVCLSGANDNLRRLASPRKGFPKQVGLHSYRLHAFWELATDLELWR